MTTATYSISATTTAQRVTRGESGEPTPKLVTFRPTGAAVLYGGPAAQLLTVASNTLSPTITLRAGEELWIKSTSGTVVVEVTEHQNARDRFHRLLQDLTGGGYKATDSTARWYDTKNTQSGGELMLNRLPSGGSATNGGSTETTTNNATFLPHTGEHYVWLPGTAATNFLSVPDEAALDITGDIDLRAEITPAQKAGLGIQSLISKRSGAPNASYQFRMQNDGALEFTWSEDGTTVPAGLASTVPVPTADGVRTWVRCTFDVDNGASGATATFYTSTDGTTWTQLGDPVVRAGATSIHSGTAPLYISSRQGNAVDSFVGRVHRAQVFNGIGGTKVLDIHPARDIVTTAATPNAGQASFTATTGQTVTVTRASTGLATAVVTRPVYVFDDTDDYLQLPAANTLTVTPTGGRHTSLVLYRRHVTAPTFERLLSWESAATDPLYLGFSSSGTVVVYGKGGVLLSSRTAPTNGNLSVAAVVVDNGSVNAYTFATGLTTNTNNFVSAAAPLTFLEPRVGNSPYSVGGTAAFQGEVFAVLDFPGKALTQAQLDTLAARLIAGDYS